MTDTARRDALQRLVTVPRTVSKRAAVKPVDKASGYEWGLSHLQHVVEELEKLEQRAERDNDIDFLEMIRASMERARQVKEEIKVKLKDS